MQQRHWLGFSVIVLLILVASAAVIARSKSAASAAPTREFSADVAGVQDGAPVTGKIYLTSEKLRMEQNSGGMETILILDRKKKIMWILNPSSKTYSEFDLNLPGVSANLPLPDETGNPRVPMKAASCTRIGQETLHGRPCDRWEVTGPAGDKTVKTTIWLNRELNAPMRWQNDGGDHFDVTNVKVGLQAASLFQVPSNYKKN